MKLTAFIFVSTLLCSLGPLAANEPGLFLPRTMELLESSGPDRKTPISILFYGQSINAQGYSDRAITQWIAKNYPDAVVTFSNPSIGGYDAHTLRHTAWQDLYNQNPDLVVFHVYGGENGHLEEIYKGMSEHLAAEVLLWTNHVDLTASEANGVREQHSKLIESLAARYGYEVADVRTIWKEELAKNHVGPQHFLNDKIHLNDAGGAILGRALVDRFKKHPAASANWKNRIHTISLAKPSPGIRYVPGDWEVRDGGLVSSGTSPLKISFTGNRVDLIGMPGFAGGARILLDGKIPSALRDTLAVGRSTNSPGAWWPAVTHVVLGENPVPQKYTMKFHNVAADGTSFQFDVTGSVSGDEGTGVSGQLFKAKSGAFSIKPNHLAIAIVKSILGKDLPSEFTIEWPVFSMSKDEWRAPAALTRGQVPQETVIRCWTDGPHTLEIIPAGDGPLGIRDVMIFSPSGKASP